MKRTVPHTAHIRFRQWSRKGYAVFCSLGRQVTIGCLSKKVADCSLTKQSKAGCNALYNEPSENKPSEEFVGNDHPPIEDAPTLTSTALAPLLIINRTITLYTEKAYTDFCPTIVLPHSIRKQEYSHTGRFLFADVIFYTH